MGISFRWYRSVSKKTDWVSSLKILKKCMVELTYQRKAETRKQHFIKRPKGGIRADMSSVSL